MPAVTVDDLTVLERLPEPGLGDQPRKVRTVTTAPQGYEGEGFPVRRAFAGVEQADLDPFIMMDQMGEVEYAPGEPKGTPWHPHRGFETVTYMIAGRMLHRDSAGHEGLLENGGVQWMTAGRGVIHSEIPQQEEGVMEGFQLWLNLPAKDKMTAPWYRDFVAAELPRFTTAAGVEAIVIAGESHGVTGAVTREATAPLYLDLHLPAGAMFAQPLPAGQPLDPTLTPLLQEVRIEDNLTLPDAFLLRISDPGLKHIDSHPLEVGSEIEIRIGGPDAKAALSRRLGTEKEPKVIEAIKKALAEFKDGS